MENIGSLRERIVESIPGLKENSEIRERVMRNIHKNGDKSPHAPLGLVDRPARMGDFGAMCPRYIEQNRADLRKTTRREYEQRLLTDLEKTREGLSTKHYFPGLSQRLLGITINLYESFITPYPDRPLKRRDDLINRAQFYFNSLPNRAKSMSEYTLSKREDNINELAEATKDATVPSPLAGTLTRWQWRKYKKQHLKVSSAKDSSSKMDKDTLKQEMKSCRDEETQALFGILDQIAYSAIIEAEEGRK
jgi:hypothetical protein